MAESNQRHYPRHSEETAIQVYLAPDYFQGRYDRCELMPAKICNQSEEGLNIEIDRALQPGSNVNIKIVESEGVRPGNAYYGRDGLVVWCKKVDGETPRFGVGIKILRKVVQSDVLTSRFR